MKIIEILSYLPDLIKARDYLKSSAPYTSNNLDKFIKELEREEKALDELLNLNQPREYVEYNHYHNREEY